MQVKVKKPNVQKKEIKFFRHVRNDTEGYGTLCLIYNVEQNDYLFGVAALNSDHDKEKFSRKVGRNIAEQRARQTNNTNEMQLNGSVAIKHNGEKFVADFYTDKPDANVDKLARSLNKFLDETSEKVFRMFENGKVGHEKSKKTKSNK